MSKMRRLLRRLKLDRVDLVPVGANPEAHIALFKSKEKPGERRISFSTQMSAGGSSLNSPWVSKEASVSDTPQNLTVEIDGEEKTFSAEDITALLSRADSADETAEKAKADLEKALKERKDKVEKDDDMAAKLQEQLDKIEKERKEADEELAKLRKAERTRTFVEKAKEFEGVGTPEEIGALLEDADENLSEAAKGTLGKLLHRAKAAAAQSETAELFKQLSDPGAEAESFEVRLEKAARKLQEQDTDLSFEQAKVKAMHADPELQKDYQEARS